MMERFAWCVFFLYAWLAGGHAHAEVPQAFMLQNSGWMEPFYLDPNSRIKAVAKSTIEAAAVGNTQIMVASFNQSVVATGNDSPRSFYVGVPATREVADALGKITLTQKTLRPVSYYDTDFFEMIEKTVAQFFQAKPGIIWVFTNNKNSPGNDQNTVARNRDYYQFLHADKSITAVLAFPIPMPVQGKSYRANALMVYAIAYGETAARELAGIIASGRIEKVLGRVPARVKPLNQNIVAFYPTAAKQGADVKVQQTSAGGLVFQFDGGKQPVTAEFSGHFRGLVYPYEISSASLGATLSTETQSVAINAEPATVKRILPGAASAPLHLSFTVPALPSYFSPQVLMKEGLSQQAELTVTLSNQVLALTPNFTAEMKSLFPEDPLLEIFSTAPHPQQSVTKIPVTIFVLHPTWPLIAAMVAACLLLFGGGWLASAMLRTPEYRVLVNGATRKIRMRPNSQYPVTDVDGKVVTTLSRGWFGGPKIGDTLPGYTVTLK